ncbi:hypothetical protein ACJJTC_012712 [Scirpophaga incertulas]
MATITNKLIEIFKNLKSDAVPNPPRTENEQPHSTSGYESTEQNSNTQQGTEDDDDHEEIIFGADDFMKDEKKSKFSFSFPSKSKKKNDPKQPKSEKNDENGSFSSVNTQASGAVFNVVNSSGVQFGSNHVYYMSSCKKNQKNVDDEEEEVIEKSNLITLLMESKIQPSHKYIDFIAKNQGVNWKSFYISLGYLKGRIETLVMEVGISEARYQLLLDWVNNDDDGTLGRLATILWDEGERQIVKELSLIHKENKKK